MITSDNKFHFIQLLSSMNTLNISVQYLSHILINQLTLSNIKKCSELLLGSIVLDIRSIEQQH